MILSKIMPFFNKYTDDLADSQPEYHAPKRWLHFPFGRNAAINLLYDLAF